MHATREAPGRVSRLEAIKAAASEAVGSTRAEEATRVVSEFRREDFGLADVRRTVWHAWAPEAMRPEDLEGHPQVWSCADQRIQAGDRIEVMHRSTKWWADAIVLSGVPGRFVAKVLRAVEFPSNAAITMDDVPPGYRIREGRPDEGYGVFFISERVEEDGHVLVRMNAGQEHRTWSECLAHLLNHPAVRDRPRRDTKSPS